AISCCGNRRRAAAAVGRTIWTSARSALQQARRNWSLWASHVSEVLLGPARAGVSKRGLAARLHWDFGERADEESVVSFDCHALGFGAAGTSCAYNTRAQYRASPWH